MVLFAGTQAGGAATHRRAHCSVVLVVSVRLQPVAFGAERGGNGAPGH